MVSISGVRGIVGDGLDPEVLVKFTTAYADFCNNGKIVIGRDARITGDMVNKIVIGTLLAKGCDVVDIGICPTPTVQYTVKNFRAAGGIAISASHNPNEWNALKLLNGTGQFLSPEEYLEFQKFLNGERKKYAEWHKVGNYSLYEKGLKKHVEDVLKLKHINLEAIRKRKFKVLADCVNGAGAYVIPDLLREFGCEVIEYDCDKTGIFPRLPEPLPENLTGTMKAVKENNVDIGFVVDPDVDRLVLITEKGEPFGEENTITQAVKFVLSKEKGNVAINLSTTRAVEDTAKAEGCNVYRAPVGEANVVKKMKEVNAVIGGEGSGGVIYPALHYGRDALVGIALTLQHMLEFGGKLSELKDSLPKYFIAKRKIEIKGQNPENVLQLLTDKYKKETLNTDDGLRIDFPDHWVHFRKSNTEPIVRCIVEANDLTAAEKYIDKYFDEIKSLL